MKYHLSPVWHVRMPTCPRKYIPSVAGKVPELLSVRDNRIEAHIVGARSPNRSDHGVRALIVFDIELFPLAPPEKHPRRWRMFARL